MSDHTDDPQDWPLRDWSARLRPPGRTESEEEYDPDEPQDEPDLGGLAGLGGDAEILFEETEEEPEEEPEQEREQEPEPDEEPAVAPVAAPSLEAEPEVEAEAAPPAVDEHAGADFQIPAGYSVLEGAPTGHRRSVAVVVSRFNGEITTRMLDAALNELDEAGVSADAVLVMPVPGAFELPLAAMALAKTRRYSCVIALGCVIRGETPHFDLVAGEAASGLQLAGIETGVPVSFGVLTCDTLEQAEARIDRATVAARTALEMADAFAQLRTTAAARQ
jgi:6,7-dimethyl-8-ribityllumazine synthase